MTRPGRPIRRTPLPPRSEYLKRGKPPRRRGRSRFPGRRDPAYLAWIRRQRCIITGLLHGQIWTDEHGRRRIARIQACHVVSRGASGADRGNAVPMLTSLHAEQHRIGIKSFEEKYVTELSFTHLAEHATDLDAAYEMQRSRERAA